MPRCTSTMTTAEKIHAIETSEMPLAWDGCHKIYFLQDDAREAEARNFGYTIYPSNELRELITSSCGLVFVSRWGFDNDDFDDPLNIEQCTQDIYHAADPSIPLPDDEDEEN